MPLTLEDIMEFMKNEKEQRQLEREQDKSELKDLISKGVKKEVETVMEPVKEKQEILEKEQVVMKQQFREVLQEMKEIKTQLQINPTVQFPGLPQPQAVQQVVHTGEQAGYVRQEGAGQGGDQQAKLRQIISVSRRTVGLHRIDSADLVRMRQAQFGGASTDAEEKLLAVQEFLRCELKLSSETIESMEIENIFAPEKREPQCLFVTFKFGSSLSRIFEKTRCMRKEARILNYIPPEFEERYIDIRDIEYSIRQDENCQTRIKMGIMDLELSKKIRGSGRWQRVPLPPGLAKIDLARTGVKAGDQGQAWGTLSPAPGRPGQERSSKRGRSSPGSPEGQSNPKTAREDTAESVRSDTREKSWQETIEKADLVTESQITPTKDNVGLVKVADTGIITSITGTPAQQSLQSPIISKNMSSRIPSLKF